MAGQNNSGKTSDQTICTTVEKDLYFDITDAEPGFSQEIHITSISIFYREKMKSQANLCLKDDKNDK